MDDYFATFDDDWEKSNETKCIFLGSMTQFGAFIWNGRFEGKDLSTKRSKQILGGKQVTYNSVLGRSLSDPLIIGKFMASHSERMQNIYIYDQIGSCGLLTFLTCQTPDM